MAQLKKISEPEDRFSEIRQSDQNIRIKKYINTLKRTKKPTRLMGHTAKRAYMDNYGCSKNRGKEKRHITASRQSSCTEPASLRRCGSPTGSPGTLTNLINTDHQENRRAARPIPETPPWPAADSEQSLTSQDRVGC